MAEAWKNRISIDSEILAGKPIAKGKDCQLNLS
jgi:hypothetical protein